MSESEPKKKRSKIPRGTALREALNLIYERRGRLLLGFTLMLVSRPAGLVMPLMPKFLIDWVIGDGCGEIETAPWAPEFAVDWVVERPCADLLTPLAVTGGLATLIQAATSFGLTLILGVAAQRSITEMRKRVEQHVARLPVSYFDSHKSGELISRVMNDAAGIRNLVGTGLVQMVGGLMTAAMAFTLLLLLNWKLTLAVLAVLLLFAGGTAFSFTWLRPVFRLRGKINAEVTGRLGELLGGVRLVKAYTAEKREDLVFAKGVHRLFRNVAKTMVGVASVTTFSTAVVGVVGMLMVWLGGRAILAGTMTVGDFMTYVLLTGMVAAPLIQISAITTQLSEAFAGIDRIREVLSLPTEDDDDRARQALVDIRGEIAFENVDFEYEPGVPVLHEISFHAPAGSTTALVGPSGSGKSTLTGLVMAFNRPGSGTIRVDGKDLSELRLRDYRANLGVVFQDNFLFDGTIVQNISYGSPGATRAEIEEAATVAHVDDFALSFPDGYDTVVGERGVKLSGGQRQRVAIARAILANPRILILDEATSSLDSESEALIQDGLQKLRHGRTTFVIAHRLSTIQSADQILVLDGGRIVESGRHEELLALEGRYRQLYDKQYRLERNRFVNPGEDFTPDLEKVEPAKGPARRGSPFSSDL